MRTSVPAARTLDASSQLHAVVAGGDCSDEPIQYWTHVSGEWQTATLQTGGRKPSLGVVTDVDVTALYLFDFDPYFGDPVVATLGASGWEYDDQNLDVRDIGPIFVKADGDRYFHYAVPSCMGSEIRWRRHLGFGWEDDADDVTSEASVGLNMAASVGPWGEVHLVYTEYDGDFVHARECL